MAIKLLRANLMYRMGFVMWADNQQTFLSIGNTILTHSLSTHWTFHF